MDNGACLYYKLPGAFGSGELKKVTKTYNGENVIRAKATLSFGYNFFKLAVFRTGK